jgi:hypothetical protein
MEAHFYSVEVEDSGFPDLQDIIAKFSEFHALRGRPEGEFLEQQMDVILFEVCSHFNIDYTSIPDNPNNVYIFMPLGMDPDEVVRIILEKAEDENSEL